MTVARSGLYCRKAITESDISILREFFLGFIKIHILYHASEGAVYGLELIEELARHGYDLSPGTLYPTLHRLHSQGYLDCEDRLDGGRRRKYYTITDKGLIALAGARRKIDELIGEIMKA